MNTPGLERAGAPKIVIVGGGSYSWGPLFVRDLLIAPELAGAQIVLHDTNSEALDTVAGLAQKLIRRLGRGSVTAAAGLSTALAGADFVILTITTGGLEAMRHDLEIPEAFGVYQSVGDTVGPGGLLRGLRNIPVVAGPGGLAQQMEQLCPRATLLNYTNPMTTLCRAVAKTSRIRTIGLCHEWLGVRRRLAAWFGVQEEDFVPRIAGINHLPWLLDLQVAGEDAMPRLHTLAAAALETHGQAAGQPAKHNTGTEGTLVGKHAGAPAAHVAETGNRSTIDRSLVKSRLLQLYGALPVAGDRHVAEFFPFFLTDAAGRGRTWGIDRTPIAERYQWRDEAKAEIDRLGADPAACDGFLAHASSEAAGPIITALWHGTRYEGIMNLPNTGQVANLPAGAVVETLGEIAAGEVRGLPAGTVPPAVESILRRHITNQELTVAAALEGRRELALQALLGDPLCPPDLAAAEKMLDAMLVANRQHLPQF